VFCTRQEIGWEALNDISTGLRKCGLFLAKPCFYGQLRLNRFADG